jgi:hypothetical protein
MQPKTLDDILDLDDELLVAPGSDIFNLRHARPAAARPDRVSERKACKDFEQFKPLFAACVFDLTAGKRKSMSFANEQEIEPGEFFILNGVMVYVAEVNDPHIRNGNRNARLRLIFENGTEGENLLRSLATELYKDPNGRRISDPTAGPLYSREATTAAIPGPEGRVTGCIYGSKASHLLQRLLGFMRTSSRSDSQVSTIGSGAPRTIPLFSSPPSIRYALATQST